MYHIDDLQRYSKEKRSQQQLLLEITTNETLWKKHCTENYETEHANENRAYQIQETEWSCQTENEF